MHCARQWNCARSWITRTRRQSRRESALRETEQQLARKTERVAALEGELAAAQRSAAELRAQLDQEATQGAGREKSLRKNVESLGQRLAGLKQELGAGAAAQRLQAEEIAEQRRCNERLVEALQTWQGFRGVAIAQLDEQDTRLVQADAQHAARLADVEARIAALQEESGVARVAAQQREAALEASLRAAMAARVEQDAALQASQELNSRLKMQLDEAMVASARVEHDLHVAEEHIHRLESDAHVNAALLGDLQQNIERLARDDTGARPILRVVSNELTEPVARVLIRNENGVDVVYPLGKRTTIGRTPDNDIQVDTTFISRHHAVLLSNPDQCVVEDLNSTNGVLINGRPVSRQALRDGDMLTVGKSEFRFQQRA